MHVLDLLDPAALVVVTALVNGLVQGLVLLVLVWGLLRMAGARQRLNATTRYAVWSVTLAVMLCLPVGAALLAATQPPQAQHSAETASHSVNVETGVSSSEEAPAPMRVLDDAALEADAALAPTDAEPAAEPMVAVSPEEAASGVTMRRPSSWRLTLPPGRWILVVFGVWLLGALVLLMRVVRGCLYVRRLKRQSTPLPPAYQRRLDAWRRAYGLRRPVRIAGVENLATPVAVGLRHPMILTPVALLHQLTDEEFDQVMLHELAHVQRRDDWTNLFQKLAEAVLFFHPAVPWIGRQMEREREMACDDWVVSLTRRPRSYASCLARLVELNVRARAVLVAPGMATRKGHLFERVRRLLDQGRHVTAHLSRAGFLTIVLALVAAFLLMERVGLFFAPPEPDVAVVVEPEVSVSLGEIAVTTMKSPSVSVEVPVGLTGVEPLIEPVLEAVVEPVGVSIAIDVAVQVDTLVTYRPIRQIRLNRLHSAAAINPVRQAPVLTEPTVQPAQAQPQDLSVRSWIRVLKAAARIASGSDRTRFLVDAAPRMPDTEAVHAAYLETAGTLSSSGDRSRALSTLLNRHRLGKASMVLFLEAIGGLPSSSDRARLLIKVARVLPNDAALHEAYLEVAESLTSSTGYRRVLSALSH